MEIKLSEKPGHSLDGGKMLVRMVALVLVLAGLAIEVWMYTQVNADLLERSTLSALGIPMILAGGCTLLRWGLTEHEVSRLPGPLRRFAK